MAAPEYPRMAITYRPPLLDGVARQSPWRSNPVYNGKRLYRLIEAASE